MLRFVDADVVDSLKESMGKLGLELRLNTPFTKVTKNGDKYAVHLKDGNTIETD